MKDMFVHLYLVSVETGSHLFQIGHNGCCFSMWNHLRTFVRILVILGVVFWCRSRCGIRIKIGEHREACETNSPGPSTANLHWEVQESIKNKSSG